MGSRLSQRLAALAALFVVSSSYAQQDPADIIANLEKSAVQVQNQTASLFTAQISGGHGTGFIVEIEDGKGRIFTNKHVIASNSFEVQNIRLQFSTDTDVPETIPGQLVYVSSIHDFAVLEFNLSDLRRARNTVQTVKLPQAGDFRIDYVRNFKKFSIIPVAAYGFPLDGTEITTFGQINGRKMDIAEGPFIQTQTPINRGNSGGPLVDLRDGTVLGVNSAKHTDAENTGYAIPIGILLEEYRLWKQNAAALNANNLIALLKLHSPSELRAEGYSEIIETVIPKYFETFKDGILGIRSAAINTGLKIGDLILAINGVAVGPSIYTLRRILQISPTTARFTIVRDHHVGEIDVPLDNQATYDARSKVDFVYLSGLLFRELPKFLNFITDPELKSEVIVSQILENTETNFQSYEFPPPGSNVIGVKIGDQEYPVHHLLDLKNILNAHRNARFIKLKVMPTKLLFTAKGVVAQMDQQYGVPVLDNHPKEFLIPLSEVITPLQLSLNSFSKQFSFDPTQFATRNWRTFVKPFNADLCTKLL